MTREQFVNNIIGLCVSYKEELDRIDTENNSKVTKKDYSRSCLLMVRLNAEMLYNDLMGE